jgi:tetraacyldisaccharide 4'-kinase
VGNLAVGGTGKTPHTEMLIRLFQKEGIKFAALSLGYKRRSKGFLYADKDSTAQMVGDEPCQVKRQFPDAIVAVCKSRVEGIKRIKKDYADVQVVILDDAMQHRQVKPGMTILLTTCDKIVTQDHMLPWGTLRDIPSRYTHADMVMVTKCPENITPIDLSVLKKELRLKPCQWLFFTAYTYGTPLQLSSNEPLKDIPKSGSVLALAGIAKPQPFFDYVKKTYTLAHTFRFADHHNFSKQELDAIAKKVQGMPDGVLFTTEKDAARLADSSLPAEVKERIYYIPIQVNFLNNGEKEFSQKTIQYVRENKKISIFC